MSRGTVSERMRMRMKNNWWRMLIRRRNEVTQGLVTWLEGQ